MTRALAAAMDLIQHLPGTISPRLGEEQHAGGRRPAGGQAFGNGVLHRAENCIDDAH
jgi:hypothetical protein